MPHKYVNLRRRPFDREKSESLLCSFFFHSSMWYFIYILKLRALISDTDTHSHSQRNEKKKCETMKSLCMYFLRENQSVSIRPHALPVANGYGICIHSHTHTHKPIHQLSCIFINLSLINHSKEKLKFCHRFGCHTCISIFRVFGVRYQF